MSTDHAPGALTWAAAVLFCLALLICGRLCEVAVYGDWDCFTKRCTVHPDANGDGDASSIP